MNSPDSIKLFNKGAKIIITAIANAAPLVIPSNAGSANGFLNNACVRAPHKPKEAPIASAESTRGNLISTKTSNDLDDSTLPSNKA